MTPPEWLLGVERAAVVTGGPMSPGFPYRLVLHDTESHGWVPLHYAVHFQAAPLTRFAQAIKLTESGFGLQHVGGIDTNRACAIQTEVDAFAKDEPWPSEWVDWLGHVHAPVMAVCGIRLVGPPHAGRMTDAEWQVFNGVCGHEHVPNQPDGHWDPGAFDWARFLTAASGAAPAPAPSPTPVPTIAPEATMFLVQEKGSATIHAIGAGPNGVTDLTAANLPAWQAALELTTGNKNAGTIVPVEVGFCDNIRAGH